MKVAVVGCGYAGASVALFLERAGHEVHVFEQVPDPGPVGAGIILQPSGQQILSALGLLGPVLSRGHRLEGLEVFKAGNRGKPRPLMHLDYASVYPGHFGLGIHRGVLFQALFDRVQQRSIDLRCGVGIERLCPNREGTLLDGRDRAYGPYELIVVADGARSQIRAADFPVTLDRPYPWGALWFVGKDPDNSFGNKLHQVVDSTKVLLGFLPTGCAPAGTGDETPLTSLFWSIRTDRIEALRARPLEAFKETVLRYEPRAESLLAQIKSHDDLIATSYRDVRMRNWHQRDRIVFIGDAAHAMSPQLGQGSNLALQDAAVLAEALEGATNAKEGIAAYTRLRRPQLRFYQAMNRALTPFFQSDSRVLGWLRDTLMPMGAMLPPIRAEMTKTMCGVKRGILRASVALPKTPPALPPP